MLTRRVSLFFVAATAAAACAMSPGNGGNSGSGSGSGSGGNSNGNGGGTSGSNSSTGSGSTSGGSGSNGGSNSGTSGSASNNSGSSSGGSGTSSSSSGSSASGGTIAGETLPGPTFVTSTASSFFQTGTMSTVTSGTATLTVNDGTAYQTFNGFGGAFNEKGWSMLEMLSASDRSKAMNLLFDWTNGAHFVFGRIPVGASDYALERYTEDDNNGQTDYNLTNFSIARDGMYLIPYVQAALAINPNIDLWASPWTPPAWMKVGGNPTGTMNDGFPDDGGNMSTSTQVLTTYAMYEAKFVQQYAAQGINIAVMMPQNEPNYAQTYPSCLWTASLYDQFVSQYLGPTFSSQNLNTQIYLGTMSCNSGCGGDDNTNYTGSDAMIVSTVTADSTAMKYIKGFSFQWNELPDVANVNKFNLPIWQTEHRAGNVPFGGETTIVNVGSAPVDITFDSTAAPNNWDYALESFGLIGQWLTAGTNQVGVTSYSAWNMVLDTVGKSLDPDRNWPQNALLTVDTSTSPATLNITPAYYAFRHFSQFIAAGATRVGTSGSTSLVSYAFKNPDGSHAVIMYNGNSTSVSTIASVGGKLIQFTVPANAFATLKT